MRNSGVFGLANRLVLILLPLLVMSDLALNGCASAASPRDESQAGGARPSSSQPSLAASDGSRPEQADRKIVYTAALSLEVEDVSDAMKSIRDLAEGVGGYVAERSTRLRDDKMLADMTLRVPASAYNQVVDGLEKLAVKVLSDKSSARDVTEEFTDLESQLRNGKAAEAQLLELFNKANTVDDILKVRSQLTEVRGQIERMQGRINLLQRTSDLATVVVSLAPAVAGRSGGPVWQPVKSVQEAWEQSLVFALALTDAALRTLVFSWWLAPPLAFLWALWRLVRRWLSRRPPAVAMPPPTEG